MIITERRLRRIIREELLRESEIDDWLDDVDNSLTAIDTAVLAATIAGFDAPITLPAEKALAGIAAAVDAVQVVRAAQKGDMQLAAENALSAIFGLFLFHQAGKKIAKAIVTTNSERVREWLVQMVFQIVDWWVSNGKIDEADAPELKKEISKYKNPNIPLPPPAPIIDDGTSENIDDGESDGSPDPYVPAQPKSPQPKPSQPRSPAAPGPASGCPISKRFYFTYDRWDTSIWDSSRNAVVAVGTAKRTQLGGTNWVIKSVARDMEGSPTSITLVDATDPGKCLMLLPLNSP